MHNNTSPGLEYGEASQKTSQTNLEMTSTVPSRSKLLGEKGEALAENFLIKHDFQILARNFHSKYGEIDIIAIRGSSISQASTIYFFEVKTRTSNSITFPEESISRKKIDKIIKTAQVFLEKQDDSFLRTKSWRIMLIGILLDRTTKISLYHIL